MTRALWNRMVLGAVVAPLVGVGFAAGSMYLVGAGDRAGAVIAYAISTMPLAAALGGAGAYLSGQAPGSPWVGGVLLAMVGALIAAIASATVRFLQAGASGFVSLSALPYTAEFLMLAGVVPAILLFGAGVGRLRAGHGIRPVVGRSLLAGVVASVCVGPTLIAVRGLAGFPLLNPVVVWALLVIVIAAVGWRRLD